MAERFDKFTERARRALTLAQEEARRFNHNYIGTEHLLLGLLSEGEGVAAKVLANLGVELKKVRSAVETIIGRGHHAVHGEIGLTPRGKKAIEQAVAEARRLNHRYIGTEHLLLGLLSEGEGIAAGVLEGMGVNLHRVRQEVTRVLCTNLPMGAGGSAATPESADIQALRAELEALRRTKEEAVAKQEYERAGTLRDQEVALQQRLVAIQRERAEQRPRRAEQPGIQLGAGFRDAFALGLALSFQSRHILELALAESRRLAHAEVGPEHLLVALLTPTGELAQELTRRGAELDTLREAVESLLAGDSGESDETA